MKKLALMTAMLFTTTAWACERPPLQDYQYAGCYVDGVSVVRQNDQMGVINRQR